MGKSLFGPNGIRWRTPETAVPLFDQYKNWLQSLPQLLRVRSGIISYMMTYLVPKTLVTSSTVKLVNLEMHICANDHLQAVLMVVADFVMEQRAKLYKIEEASVAN